MIHHLSPKMTEVKSIHTQNITQRTLKAVAHTYRPLSMAIALMGLSSIATAQEFSQTVFFGDSLTDTGRLVQIGKNSLASSVFNQAQPSFTTNTDPVWSSILAKSYGHTADANDGTTLTGTNYAVGGARTKEDVVKNAPVPFFTIPLFTIPSAQTQINRYLTLNNHQADPKALYTVWTGANDLFEAAKAPTQLQAAEIITTAANDQANLVGQLGQAGAKHILVPSLPDVGVTPEYAQDPTKSATASLSAHIYNQTLYQSLNNQTTNVIAANTFALLKEAVSNPAGFGFSNVTEPACQNLDANLSSLACKPSDWQQTAANANETYAFADKIHPSGRTHRILAQYYRSIIDSPTQMGQLPQHLIKHGQQSQQQLVRRLDSLNNHQQSLWIDGSISNHALDTRNKIDRPTIKLGLDIARPNQHTGAYLTYQQQDYHLSDSITADVKQTGIGLYHRHDFDHLRISANLGVDHLSTQSLRQIMWDGENRNHQAHATGKRRYASVQGSYGFTQNNVTYRPYVGIHAQDIKQNRFFENQPNLSTALSFKLPDHQSLQADIGVNIDYAMNDKLNLLAGLGYQHEFKDNNKTVETAVLSNRDYHRSFVTTVPFDKKHTTHAHLGATLALGNNTHLNAGIQANHQDHDTKVGGFVGAQMAF